MPQLEQCTFQRLWPLLIHPKYCLTNIVLKIIFIPKISISVDETMWLKTVVLNMTQGFLLLHPSTTQELSQDLFTAQGFLNAEGCSYLASTAQEPPARVRPVECHILVARQVVVEALRPSMNTGVIRVINGLWDLNHKIKYNQFE
jgi:hypothetical protein